MRAQDFLTGGAKLLDDRGKEYDSDSGERSMGKAVSAFNSITGKELKEADGWLLLQVLKDCRQWQTDRYHADSAEDCVAYAALKAEALSEHAKEDSEKKDAEECNLCKHMASIDATGDRRCRECEDYSLFEAE